MFQTAKYVNVHSTHHLRSHFSQKLWSTLVLCDDESREMLLLGLRQALTTQTGLSGYRWTADSREMILRDALFCNIIQYVFVYVLQILYYYPCTDFVLYYIIVLIIMLLYYYIVIWTYLSLRCCIPCLVMIYLISLELLFISVGRHIDRFVISSMQACLHSVSGLAICPNNHITASFNVAFGGQPLWKTIIYVV